MGGGHYACYAWRAWGGGGVVGGGGGGDVCVDLEVLGYEGVTNS